MLDVKAYEMTRVESEVEKISTTFKEDICTSPREVSYGFLE